MNQIPTEIVDSLQEVPESIITEYAENSKIENSGWKQLLKAAQIFKHAGCEPIFLTTPDESRWVVSSKETFKKKLH
jgi:hypothetical protein